jgi:2-hydroxychromene-2-carboxylate isomerase
LSTKKIEYFYSVSSPWSYLGTPRLIEIAARHQATIDLMNILIVQENGAIPLRSRPKARQDYHQLELDRWRKFLGMPLNLAPKFYPTQSTPAGLMVVAAKLRGLDALKLSFALQRALWAQDRDIADTGVRRRIADETGFDGAALVAAEDDARTRATWEQNKADAISRGVFGTPTYVYRGELFWGQDRLEFLDRALAAA